MRDADGLVAEFIGVFGAEHGHITPADVEFLEPFIRDSFVTEGHVTPAELDDLIMGVEDDSGASVPPDLARRFPRLNTLAVFGLSYDEDDIRRLLGR